MGLGFPGFTVNGTDSVDLPPSSYEPPSSASAWDAPLDNEEEEKVWKAANPPGGYYEVMKFSAFESEREAEYYIQVTDGYEKVRSPRTVTTYSGKGFLVKDGKEWTPRLRVRVSPVCAYAKDKDGNVVPDKLDSAYKLFQHARIAYKEATGENPPNARSIDAFLQTFPFKVQTMQVSSGDLIVLGLQVIKPA